MPRNVCDRQGGYTDHVLNWGNARAEVFYKEGDYLGCLPGNANCAVKLEEDPLPRSRAQTSVTALNRSAIGPNQSRRWADFLDGLSQTLIAAEVKNYQPYLRDCGRLSQFNNPNNIPSPNADPMQVAPEYAGGSCTLRTDGHAEWVDGGVHHVNPEPERWDNERLCDGCPGFNPPDRSNLAGLRRR